MERRKHNIWSSSEHTLTELTAKQRSESALNLRWMPVDERIGGAMRCAAHGRDAQRVSPADERRCGPRPDLQHRANVSDDYIAVATNACQLLSNPFGCDDVTTADGGAHDKSPGGPAAHHTVCGRWFGCAGASPFIGSIEPSIRCRGRLLLRRRKGRKDRRSDCALGRRSRAPSEEQGCMTAGSGASSCAIRRGASMGPRGPVRNERGPFESLRRRRMGPNLHGAMPKHVACVMDGNGRWAERMGLPRTAGHKAGEAALHRIVCAAIEIGIDWLTVFAFSTENWLRPPAEVQVVWLATAVSSVITGRSITREECGFAISASLTTGFLRLWRARWAKSKSEREPTPDSR